MFFNILLQYLYLNSVTAAKPYWRILSATNYWMRGSTPTIIELEFLFFRMGPEDIKTPGKKPSNSDQAAIDRACF